MLAILRHTPPWVFGLFVVLLVFGWSQSRPRTSSLRRVAILPVAMIALSLYAALSVFGASATAIAAWIAGLALAIALNSVLCLPRGVRAGADNGTVHIPGSWLPLGLMMAIFFARYAVAVMLALRPGIVHTAEFTAAVGLAYGFLSGLFLAFFLRMWRIARASPATFPAELGSGSRSP